MDVLAVCAALALDRGTRLLEPAAVEAACADVGMGRDALLAALVDLRNRGHVQLQTADPSRVVLLAVTDAGLAEHLGRARPGLPEFELRLAAAVHAAQGAGPVDLAAEVAEPPLLVECTLDRWVAERRVVYSKAPGRRFRIHRVLDRGLPGTAAASAEPAAG